MTSKTAWSSGKCCMRAGVGIHVRKLDIGILRRMHPSGGDLAPEDAGRSITLAFSMERPLLDRLRASSNATARPRADLAFRVVALGIDADPLVAFLERCRAASPKLDTRGDVRE